MKKVLTLLTFTAMFCFGQDILDLETVCNSGDAKSCRHLGNLYYHGQGVEQDYKKAFEFYTKGHHGGDAKACGNLGVLYENGHGVEQDHKKAFEHHTKGCDGGSAEACYNLANLYYDSEVKLQAKEYFGKACHLGEQDGCSEYAKLNLSEEIDSIEIAKK